MVYQLRLRKKGIIILPKEVRQKLNVKENDVFVAEVKDNELVLRPLKPEIVRVDPGLVDEILREEKDAEERKEREILGSS